MLHVLDPLADRHEMTDGAFGMLERSRRPASDQDRALIERYRKNAIGITRFDAKFTFLSGAAGLVVGFVWLQTFRWPVVALTLVGTIIGFFVDYGRYKRERVTREAAAAAQWNPVLAADVVEHVVAEAGGAVRVDDEDGNSAWFLQAGENEILCVWDWVEHATERVEIDFVPGSSPTTVAISWSGKQLKPESPTRTFRRGEREPEQCEVLEGTLQELDHLLRDGRDA
jgi:hypothetical protein